jgi:DNA excision repair protein ERCC-3
VARFGRVRIERDDEGLKLVSAEPAILAELAARPKIAELFEGPVEGGFRVRDWARGQLKQSLLKIGWPAEDFAGFTPGAPFDIELDETSWSLRQYQKDAVARFEAGGSGVVVLPCGAGKTLVGAAAMAACDTNTLILVTNTVSARQWRDELLARTSLKPEDIGEYSGAQKDTAPVTIATYQILTTKRAGEFSHLQLLNARDWGLVIYDEVHLLPAPIFKMTADLQARRRLGLTATLVREDGKEGDVFSLIGPKRFDAPWKEIESEGYIAPAECFEIRVDLPEDERLNYAIAEQDERYRLAATSKIKIPVIQKLLKRHNGEPTLIIGQYLDQIDEVANLLGVPKITGETPVNERERLFQAFREGSEPTLVVSKVANFSVDLPEASVAIQISGSYGSRQEEAQRLGRLLRPKADGRTASFYTLIARDTVDQDFAQNRQRFLAEQGYSYKILDVSSI